MKMPPRIHTEICNTFYQKNGIASLYLFDRVKKIMQIICFSHVQWQREHTSDSGTVIRFIVIKKPNSSAYGIGLDACDICGETGYYEKNGQVVCNLCDVVMNINTIGFKGVRPDRALLDVA